jgi:superfamily II RNA helicase
VLKELGYVDPEAGTVALKGRAACEINSTQDELLATEALFRGLLTGLTPPEAVALLSALVFQVGGGSATRRGGGGGMAWVRGADGNVLGAEEGQGR